MVELGNLKTLSDIVEGGFKNHDSFLTIGIGLSCDVIKQNESLILIFR